jgi:hypothetical protein
LKGFFAIRGFRHDFHFTAFFNDPAQAGPHNAVVICQKNLYHYLSPDMD